MKFIQNRTITTTDLDLASKIKALISSKNVDLVEANDSHVLFRAKNIMNYLNYDYLLFIDEGMIKIEEKGNKTLLKYVIVSYRVLIFAIIGGLMGFMISKTIFSVLLFSLVVFLFSVSLIKSGQKRLLDEISNGYT